MPQARRIIIGLGNPGAEYEDTRHNVGFMVIDDLAARTGTVLQREKGDVLLGWGRHRGYGFGLAKPQTFMNRSGSAVLSLVRRFGLQPAEILVVLDDLSLEPGRLRLRERGSAGGHNGMQDIIDRLGTDDIPRLRIGIGNDYPRGRQADYVLSPFSFDEKPLVADAVAAACDAALTFVSEGTTTAMNRFNR